MQSVASRAAGKRSSASCASRSAPGGCGPHSEYFKPCPCLGQRECRPRCPVGGWRCPRQSQTQRSSSCSGGRACRRHSQACNPWGQEWGIRCDSGAQAMALVFSAPTAHSRHTHSASTAHPRRTHISAATAHSHEAHERADDAGPPKEVKVGQLDQYELDRRKDERPLPEPAAAVAPVQRRSAACC